jgi:predicted nucleotidyltransferase component of viral defense system
MNELPDRDTLLDVALEMGIHETFVEKDWYVTQIIRQLVEQPYDSVELIFTGGTALSKAHKLIERFSEDIDFRVVLEGEPTTSAGRRILSGFKNEVSQRLASFIEIQQVKARNNNQYIGLELTYPTIFSLPTSLRPHIKVEFTLAPLQLPSLMLPVGSFVGEAVKLTPEVAQVACIDPVENAADKLSALVWRVAARQAETTRQPDMVRHLHDLAQLTDLASTHTAFVRLARQTIEQDDSRAPRIAGLTINQKLDHLFSRLNQDTAYAVEYDIFVGGVSYARHKPSPTFLEAIDALKRLTTIIRL